MSGGDVRISVLPRSRDSDRTVIGVREYQGARFVDLRIYYVPEGGDGELKPTQKGVTLRAGDVDLVVAALTRAKLVLEGDR